LVIDIHNKIDLLLNRIRAYISHTIGRYIG